jgi:hypothetical protein
VHSSNFVGQKKNENGQMTFGLMIQHLYETPSSDSCPSTAEKCVSKKHNMGAQKKIWVIITMRGVLIFVMIQNYMYSESMIDENLVFRFHML